jgi:hypothetical protein
VRRVRELVTAVSRDDSALRNLRFDPGALARSLNLGAGHLAALHSAERFFEAESPILDRPASDPAVPRLGNPAEAGFAAAPPSLAGLVASAETGALLTGPTTGTYTISSSATATGTAAAPPPPPAPPGPVTPPPPITPPPVTPPPITPPVPPPPVTPPPVTAVPPPFPCPPVTPAGPPPVPAMPCPPPAGPALPPCPADLPALAASLSGHVCCPVAITAMVAEVSATADAAIAALAALARLRQQPGDHASRGPTA